ncbi:uncharacterized protein C18orf63 homolog [Salarias fasciatus]|uniref:uncharacterized protein C18orf63 homolog n=1 Tax=Salarias fasciatus TaxID=181472 RepID=UPI0011765812|nr:uncharacterized protein C18orf63 homolog [Salarias fasciatus]
MSGNVPQSLFFLQTPDLKALLSVTLSLQEDEEPRTRQIQTCRELVLLFQDVVACPALDSFTEITALMTIPFFHKGIVQAFAHRRHLQLAPPQCVFPADLQRCLSYSLVTRLAPGWNKAGLHLVCGKDFLTERGRLNAVSFKMNASNGQLCLSVEARTVRLPPTTLEDFGFPPLVLRRFFSDPDYVLDPGCLWCHVLPSMKKGQIISISRRLPADGPFRTYGDLQRHWNLLYGYRLPQLLEEKEVYCSVYFKLVGQKLFTYPLSCIRLQPPQCCPRADLQGALRRFLSDARDALRSVCGVPARLSSRPRYGALGLTPASAVQESDGEQMNLTAASSSIRPVLTQLPPLPPPPLPPQPGRSLFGPQPPASSLVCQQGGAVELADGRFHSRVTQCTKDAGWPSSFSTSSLPQHRAAPPLISTSSVPLLKPPSSSSSSLPSLQTASSVALAFSPSPFQPASSLNSTCSLQLHRQARSCSTPSSTLPPPPPPPPPAHPKLVPIFKNKHPSRHVNVALLRAEKERRRVGGEERVTLPPFGRTTPTTSTSPAAPPFPTSLPLRPPPIVPRFNRQPKRPRPSDPPNVRHLSSLSPKIRPGAVISPKLEVRAKTKPILKTSGKTSSEKTRAESSRDTQEDAASWRPPAAPSEPQNSTDKDPTASREKKVAFKIKAKKSKPAVEDVEQMARNNQLSRLSSSSLSAWLKLRGVPVSAKLKKDELMLKVMSCLAEA